MDIKQEFQCDHCHASDIFEYQSRSQVPVCCAKPMRGGKVLFPRGDEKKIRLHLIKLRVKPVVEWSLPTEPVEILELWRLAPGRANGEFIGWIGPRATAVEWRTPKGVSIPGGFSNTVEEAAGHLLEALDGGVFAAQNISSKVVS